MNTSHCLQYSTRYQFNQNIQDPLSTIMLGSSWWLYPYPIIRHFFFFIVHHSLSLLFVYRMKKSLKKSKMMSLNCSFWLTNHPKSKYLQFFMRQAKCSKSFQMFVTATANPVDRLILHHLMNIINTSIEDSLATWFTMIGLFTHREDSPLFSTFMMQ